jgi:hypothetical protein
MKDIIKWFAGLATLGIIALVTLVFNISNKVTVVGTEMRSSNTHIVNTIRNHGSRLSAVETSVTRLQSSDAIHTRYDSKIDELLPVVQAIKLIMEKD